MTRPVRPSDVFRLPGAGDDEPPAAPHPERPGRGRVWVGVVLLLVTGVGIAGVGASRSGGGGTTTPVVDIVSEDQVIAALTLYGAQADAVRALAKRRDVYAGGGPPAAAGAASEALGKLTQALQQARAQTGADPLVSTYWNDGNHLLFVDVLANVAATAELIAVLTATHDTLFSGSGQIPLDEAHQRLVSMFGEGRQEAPLTAWAQALLGQLEGKDRAAESAAGKAGAAQLWQSKVDALQPQSVDALRTYLGALPPSTLRAVRGHPVAGPALRELEEQSRQVSRAA